MHPENDTPQTHSELNNRLDGLIDAIIDQPEDALAWNEFAMLAANSSQPWHRLAEQQRLARQLSHEYEHAVAPAMKVELPARQTIPIQDGVRWAAPLRAYVGWAAAILMALGWLIDMTVSPAQSDPSSVATVAADNRALLDRYLDQDHVVGELPSRLYDVQYGENGRIVTIVRQILERRTVQMYDFAVEDGLNPVLRPNTDDSSQLASRF